MPRRRIAPSRRGRLPGDGCAAIYRLSLLALSARFAVSLARAAASTRRNRKPVLPDKSLFSLENIVVSVLGGVAAAVIFTVVSRGGSGGLFFAHLAPLPLMIVALGYGVRHGATAALLATTIISIYPHPVLGMAYALLVAGPAWAACYALAGAPRGSRDLLQKNLPAWGLLAPATILAFVVILWLIVASVVAGSPEEALNPLRARIFILLEAMDKEKAFDFRIDPVWLSGVLTIAAPATIAFYILLIQFANLWIAGRLALASGLLTQPWPDIAAEFRLPKPVGGLFVIGVVAGFFGVAPAAVGYVLAATMGLLLALQGFAVLHVRLRGYKYASPILALIYFVSGLLGWPIIVFALIGLVDLFLDFRARKTPPASGPDHTTAAELTSGQDGDRV